MQQGLVIVATEKKLNVMETFLYAMYALKEARYDSYAENYMQFNTSNSLSSPAHMYGTARSEVQEMRILDNLLYMKTLGALL